MTSINTMKQALEALEGINDEDRDKDFLTLKQFVRLDMAIEALRTAIQQAEAKTDEMDQMFVKGALSGIVDAQVRDLWPTKSATHPAPGVPDGYVLVPLQVLRDASDALGNFINDLGWDDSDMQAWDNLDAYIAQHTAAQAQKGQP